MARLIRVHAVANVPDLAHVREALAAAGVTAGEIDTSPEYDGTSEVRVEIPDDATVIDEGTVRRVVLEASTPATPADPVLVRLDEIAVELSTIRGLLEAL